MLFTFCTPYQLKHTGYHGMSMKNSYYGWLPRKVVNHEWAEENKGLTFGFEWPAGWIGIDGDEVQSRETF